MNLRGKTLAGLAAGGVLVTWVWLPFIPFSVLGDANLALQNALVAVSLVILTGWVGQISLAQASFVGIGAFTTGLIVRAWGIDFPLNLPFAAAAGAFAAAALGLVALRVRGLYLAVATLIFAWMSDAYLFSQPWFSGAGGSSTIRGRSLGKEGGFPYLDFTDRRTFYYVGLAATAAAIIGAANLRGSRTGRAWFALRGSEIAAASLGVNVTRYKLLAFAVSGFIAGVAGNLFMTNHLNATPASFTFLASLFYLAVAVVGGLSSLGGAVAAGSLFAALQEAFFRLTALQGLLDVVSAVLLAAVLVFFPSGLAGIPARLGPAMRGIRAFRWGSTRRRSEAAGDGGRTGGRLARFLFPAPVDRSSNDALASGNGRRKRASGPGAPEPPGGATVLEFAAGTSQRAERPLRDSLDVVLAARNVTVRFGGLTAVDDASLEVRRGEIVGLIGPNGAGKTTLFNAISGLNEPASGTIELFGENVTSLPVHHRAARGMGRTFQVIQLFPQLSVFDNLLVATHAQNRSGFASHLFATEHAVRHERVARERVAEVIRLLGLEDGADRKVLGLPFGMLRLVEVARALVTGAPFVMLDEPASGLDNTETDRFMDLLFFIREQLAMSLLVIEHDVRMVTGVSDHMYVIDAGRLIAEGTPAEIQRDPAVIAAYLGDVAVEAKAGA